MSNKNVELEKSLFNISELISINSEFLNSPVISSVKEFSNSFSTFDYSTPFANTVSAMVANFSDISRTNSGIKVACEAVSRNLSLINHTSANTLKAIMVSDSLTEALKTSASSFSSLAATQNDDDLDDYIDLPEDLAASLSEIDDSVILPKANTENIVRVEKSNRETYLAVIGILLALITLVYTFYQDQQQTIESQKQTEILKQIEKNTSPIMPEQP